MDQAQNLKIPRSALDLIILLSVQRWGILCEAPQGCANSNGVANCDFKHWAPPLLDQDFGGPVHDLSLNNINGTIPDGAFSGLNDPLKSTQTYMRLSCGPDGHIRLLRNSFSPNLHWIVNLRINKCHIKNGLPSRLLENLQSLKYFTIDGLGSEIEGSVAHDALTGLENLQVLTIRSPVNDGKLPAGLFEGLTNLTIIKLIDAELHCIPPNAFNGLVNLQIIHLFGNNLAELPEGLFDELGSLAKLDLHGNPWNCSCGLRWLIDWNDVTDRGGECAAPFSVQGERLEDALSTLKCTPSTPNALSKSGRSETEVGLVTETQALSFHTVAALSTIIQAGTTINPASSFMVTGTATFLQTDRIDPISVYTKSFETSSTLKYTPLTKAASTKEVPVTVALTTLPSWSSSKGTEIQATTFSNNLRNMILASAVGISTAFLVAGTLLCIYRFLCRNIRFPSVNQVSNDDESNRNPELHRTDGSIDQDLH